MSFPRNFSCSELKNGVSMIVHPISGEPMNELMYSDLRHVFYRLIPDGAWDPNPEVRYEPAIPAPADGVVKDQAFPDSWNIDPYTGIGIPGTY